jgi:adenosine 3'-phospho 5'-phosphosulfate transporter B3
MQGRLIGVLQNPVETYGYAFIFSTLGYLGVNVVLTLVTSFGAFLAVTVTTLRKALTITLSFMFFAKPFTYQSVLDAHRSCLTLFLQVYLVGNDSAHRSVPERVRQAQRPMECSIAADRS